MKKILLFSDLHIGKKQDYEIFLQEDITFVNTVCEVAKEREVDEIIFLGDFVDKRNSYSPKMLVTAVALLVELDNLGIPVYIILGNHDLFYRNSRKLHFFSAFRNFFNNVKIISQVEVVDNKLLVPWVLEEEREKVKKMMNEYPFVFGHFEFKDVPLHSNYYTKEGFENNFKSYIFSGHFHNVYKKDNLVYIGSPYAFDFGHISDEYGMYYIEIEGNKLKKQYLLPVAGIRFLKLKSLKDFEKIKKHNQYYVSVIGENTKEILEKIEEYDNIFIVNIIEKKKDKNLLELEEEEEEMVDFSDVLDVLLGLIDKVVDKKKAQRLKEKIRIISKLK